MAITGTLPEYNSEIAVLGMGYVGIPLFIEIARKIRPRRLVGYDTSNERIEWLLSGAGMSEYGYDLRLTELANGCEVELSSDPERLNGCKIFIIAVPTPVNRSNVPDLSMMAEAAACAAESTNTSDGRSVIVFESTVYPGACREIVESIEHLKELNRNGQIGIGYSPERINPGDQNHRLTNTVKIVSGESSEIGQWVQGFYNLVVEAGTHLAPSIEVAEAAKVLENTQRDINISLANEMALICSRLGIETSDVLEAAETKWNFMKIRPGLVGGHCIGVDPYYLAYKAEEVGIHPQLILAGRNVNDNMPGWIARKVLKEIMRRKDYEGTPRCLIMGATFKEDCNDTRNSKSLELCRILKDYGVDVTLTDPLAQNADVEIEGLIVKELGRVIEASYDAVVIAVGHAPYLEVHENQYEQLIKSHGFIFDLKGVTRKKQLSNAIYL